MEAKINPLNGFSQQVNHNLIEIRRLFNPQTAIPISDFLKKY